MGVYQQDCGSNKTFEFMKTLRDYLVENDVDEGLQSVFFDLAEAIKDIAEGLRFSHGSGGKVGSENIYGEEQIQMDVVSNDLLTNAMKENPAVGLVVSEEMDGEFHSGSGEYAVCYDPLDGSSLADVNLSVGTILGIYKAKTLIGVKGDEQVAAMVAVYGPSTTFFLTVRKGVAQFFLNEDGKFVLIKDDFKIAEEGKMFAPGNLRACKLRKDYLKLVDYWCENGYKLRYSGGMVPDINQILIKGKGIFSYPGYGETPDGKLRLLIECAPMALLVEEAGGAASDGKMRILEKEVNDLAQRSPIFIGSKLEVERCEQFLQ